MKKKIILASGRMHVYKQFDLLIKAFSDLSKIYLDWDLVILGSGDEREELQKLVLKLEIESRVHMPGSVGNISDWYERADIFALSSVVEGFPNVSQEEYEQRMLMCNSCEFLNKKNSTCNVCGCAVEYKGRMETERCPENRW